MKKNLLCSTDNQAIEAKWDALYEKASFSVAANVLLENSFLLPEQGNALDLASGLGENALFLAEQGLDVNAWDISSVALNKLQHKAAQKSLNISVKQIALEPNCIPKNTFNVIVVSRFLDRSLSNAIIEGLKPDGLLFYQTFVRDKLTSSGPKNPKYLLARNELLKLFQPLKIVFYEENSRIGNLAHGERSEALLIGQKC